MAYLHSITFNGDESEIPSGGGGAGLESITYSALLAKRNGGQLTPGGQYRITDYVCTTTQAESRAVSHPFDIIVVADDESTLNENARACLHEGDTYYSAAGNSAVLEAWELKYCIDNDTDRFAWADTVNGKGVIFYMKDEKNNECPYDFKQIQFKRYKVTACSVANYIVGAWTGLQCNSFIENFDTDNPEWFYTFSMYDFNDASAVIYDASIGSQDNSSNGCIVHSNVIKEFKQPQDLDQWSGPNIIYLNDICFYNDVAYGRCFNNRFDNEGSACTFGGGTFCNAFGTWAGYNITPSYANFYYNEIKNYFSNNLLGEGFKDNVVGDNFGSNIANSTEKNVFAGEISGNTFVKDVRDNVFLGNISENTFGDTFQANTVISVDHSTIGKSVTKSRFTSCSYVTVGDYCLGIVFEPSTAYIDLSGGSNNLTKVRYYVFMDGTGGSSGTHLSVTGATNNNYTTYVGKDSNGVVKTFSLADLAP